MPRGQAAEVGTERRAKNGYWYVKCLDEDNDGKTKWVLKHHLVAQQKLGRRLKDEQARFKDGNIENFDPDNIEVVPLGRANLRRRIAQLNARIAELTALRDGYQRQHDSQSSSS